MKKLFLLSFTVLLLAVMPRVQAQEWIKDSISVGRGAETMVFYGFKNQSQHTFFDNLWHVAFSVQPSQFPSNTLQGTSIRVNNGKEIRVFVAPDSIGVDDFDNLDTTGMMQDWEELIDSDSTWDIGALNSGLDMSLFPHEGGPDYGWGLYDMESKHVESKGRIYVFIKDSTIGFGPNRRVERVLATQMYIEALLWDTLYVFNHAIVGQPTTKQRVEINKKNYPNQHFAYFSFRTGQQNAVEPPKEDWDMLFTDFYTLAVSPNFGPPQFMRVTGTLSKKGTQVYRVTDQHPDSVVLQAGLDFSEDKNTIGYDWKTHVGQGVYEYADSLTFIVRTTDDTYYKLHFTEFGGVGSGLMKFQFMELDDDVLSVQELMNPANPARVAVYPNPASGSFSVKLNLGEQASVQLRDLRGKLVANQAIEGGVNHINVQTLPAGMYFVEVVQAGHVSKHKLIVH